MQSTSFETSSLPPTPYSLVSNKELELTSPNYSIEPSSHSNPPALVTQHRSNYNASNRDRPDEYYAYGYSSYTRNSIYQPQPSITYSTIPTAPPSGYEDQRNRSDNIYHEQISTVSTETSNIPTYSQFLRNTNDRERQIGISPSILQQEWPTNDQLMQEKWQLDKPLARSENYSLFPKYADTVGQINLDQTSPGMPMSCSVSGKLSDEDSITSRPKLGKAPTTRKRLTGKPNVARACSNCKKAHLGCDESRPCGRCVGLGKQDTCIDVEGKKRGRPKIRSSVDGDMSMKLQEKRYDNIQSNPPFLLSPKDSESSLGGLSYSSMNSASLQPLNPIRPAPTLAAKPFTPQLEIFSSSRPEHNRLHADLGSNLSSGIQQNEQIDLRYRNAQKNATNYATSHPYQRPSTTKYGEIDIATYSVPQYNYQPQPASSNYYQQPFEGHNNNNNSTPSYRSNVRSNVSIIPDVTQHIKPVLPPRTFSLDDRGMGEKLVTNIVTVQLRDHPDLFCITVPSDFYRTLDIQYTPLINRSFSDVVHFSDKPKLKELYERMSINFGAVCDSIHLLTNDGPQLFLIELRRAASSMLDEEKVITCEIQKYAHSLFRGRTPSLDKDVGIYSKLGTVPVAVESFISSSMPRQLQESVSLRPLTSALSSYGMESSSNSLRREHDYDENNRNTLLNQIRPTLSLPEIGPFTTTSTDKYRHSNFSLSETPNVPRAYM
ncbi:hypothetical protein HK098_003831 [Nowakowskiella sp. JEL0407]|nr:hypothetical protein HK098_003831 [Nowakowskiella sp. JEL0407]